MMTSELVFMMGSFEARFPTDRVYAKNHMWAEVLEPSVYRFGFSAYAVRLLQDVYFLDLTIEPEIPVKLRQEIGSIESKKAESSLHSPLAGVVTRINASLIQDPTAINLDKYGAGWLFELRASESITESITVPTTSETRASETRASRTPGENPGLLSPDQYIEHLNAAWEVAQRTIKGQVNAE